MRYERKILSTLTFAAYYYFISGIYSVANYDQPNQTLIQNWIHEGKYVKVIEPTMSFTFFRIRNDFAVRHKKDVYKVWVVFDNHKQPKSFIIPWKVWGNRTYSIHSLSEGGSVLEEHCWNSDSVCFMWYYDQQHNDFNNSDFRFQPSIISNELNLLQNASPALLKFPSNGGTQNFSYSSLCDFDESSRDGVLQQCLSVALSVLVTNPVASYTFLISRRKDIGTKYLHLIHRLNIHIYYFKDLKIPPAAIALHLREDKGSWITSYQRIHMFRLPYKRVLFLDSDMVVVRNIDHLFLIERSMFGGDCTPHIGSPPDRRHSFSEGYRIGSIQLVTPSERNFSLLLSSLRDGTIRDEFGNVTGWKYPQTDQSLFPALFDFGQLPCEYQTFPDICFHAPSPRQDFPLSRFFMLHFTWIWHKGSAFFKDGVFQFYADRFQTPINGDRERHREAVLCWNEFGLVLEHFLAAVKLLLENRQLAVKDALLSDANPVYVLS